MASGLDWMPFMGRLRLLIAGMLLILAAGHERPAAAQELSATFRSSVDLVRLAAVVRDRRGRFIPSLSARDFEVLDEGKPRPIEDFRHDAAGLSVALLFDISGSMEGSLASAREAASHVLSWLTAEHDESAVFTFDTQLDEVVPLTARLKVLPDSMTALVPFGATSLHDAIARTAERLATRGSRRRAIVVLTDGHDTASRLSPAEVSAIASAIDVPVYIVGVVAPIDNPSAGESTKDGRSSLTGSLNELASWTGGTVFVTSSPVQRAAAARRIVEELRQQYLIVFESSGTPGWHPLVVRVRDKDLVVRARSGYYAGQSRPNSD